MNIFSYDNPLSTKELLSLVDENFFNIVDTKRKLTRFTRIFIDAFCREHGVTPADFMTAEFKDSCFAYYNVDKMLIVINSAYTRSYSEAVRTKNYYFVFHYFDTILHELRHHLQNTSAKELNPIIKNVTRVSRNYFVDDMFYSASYGMHPLELDARYQPYNLLKDNSAIGKYFYSKNYIEFEIEKHKKQNMQVVEILKNKDFNNIKYIAKPRTALKACVKQIALKNGLTFVGTQSEVVSKEEKANDKKLNKAIAKEIAPKFFDKTFKTSTLSDEENSNINEEYKEFNKSFHSKIKNFVPDLEKKFDLDAVEFEKED